MKSTLMTSGLAMALVAGAVASTLAADGVMLVQHTTMGQTQQTTQVQIEKNRIRADVLAGMGGKQAIIFDAAKQVVDIVNLDKKTYSELTKAQIDQLGGAMQDMMSQMQSAMANMPPAQRAQMEAMMRGRGMGAAAPKPEYHKTGTDHVGKWTCDKYEGMTNGQKTTEVCTVDPSVLGLTAADVDTFKQLGEFFKKLVPRGAGMPDITDPGYSGIPVRTVTTAGGTNVTSEITDVSRQSFSDAIFTVPAGFTKEDFPMMAPGGGRRGR